ncbi:RNA-binding protein [Lysobacteraceae bacterium NML75-0749]|nr:RNA-binding protein [Xanthomonadaceae bacterium NML75-0749]PJK05986.1 RNA-binding protein [Xanthomonadaceae bacterium NML91-0268]
MKPLAEPLASLRLDIWLWAARFFKTRELAKQAIEAGRVEVDGQRAKPARALRGGETLTVVRGVERFELEVRALDDRRGPASHAQTLYLESESSISARAAARAEQAAARAGYQPPQTRPDKRARRLIRALGDIDAL